MTIGRSPSPLAFCGAVACARGALLLALVPPACGGETSTPRADAGSAIDVTSSTDVAGSFDAAHDFDGPLDRDGGACARRDPVTFQLRVTEGSTNRYCIGSGCSHEWISLSSPQGQAVLRNPACGLRCGDCAADPCDPICPAPKLMKDGGEVLAWDGKMWIGSTCMGKQCKALTCATADRFVATMCARSALLLSDGSASCPISSATPMTCVDVEFERSTTSVVQGILP
jgi:hypothetical protein